MKKPHVTNALRTICLLLLGATLLALYNRYQSQPNALKVHTNGLTAIVRWPHADHYKSGDAILLNNEDGSRQLAIVVEPVSVDNFLMDDERTENENAVLPTSQPQ